MLYFIDQRLCQASGKQDEIFGGFIIIFVGDFQQLPPVGDIPLYEEGGYGNILFETIEYLVQHVESHRHHQEEYDNGPAQRHFKRF